MDVINTELSNDIDFKAILGLNFNELDNYTKIITNEPKGTFEYNVAKLLLYFHSLDDYTLKVIILMARNPACTVTHIAQLHGVSRQAMHRKMQDMAKKHPELSGFIKTYLPWERKKKDFERRHKDELEQLKANFK